LSSNGGKDSKIYNLVKDLILVNCEKKVYGVKGFWQNKTNN